MNRGNRFVLRVLLLWPPSGVTNLFQFDIQRTVHSYNKSQRDALISQIYFWNRILHVSDRISAHHQESSTVYTAIGICHTGYRDCLLVLVLASSHHKFEKLVHLVGFIIRNLFQFSRIINIVLIRSSTTSTSLPSGRRKIFLFQFLSSHPFSLTSGTSSCETEVLTAVLINVRIFWDVTPCRLINSCLLVL